MGFELHPQLAADTHEIGELPLSQVVLMNDSRFPWIILVPRVENARDLIDLSSNDQIRLTEEISATSKTLRTLFAPDKLNVAALGNMVPQLHVHVIARRINDAAWPSPVWGVGSARPYAPQTLVETSARLAAKLGISA